jgi:hypothetical protein
MLTVKKKNIYRAEIIVINRITEVGFFVVAQWANWKQFFYHIKDDSHQTGNPFLKEKRIRKMVYRDGQWVAATLND